MIKKILIRLFIENNPKPDNSVSVCACKHYPTNCTYCHDMIADNFGY